MLLPWAGLKFLQLIDVCQACHINRIDTVFLCQECQLAIQSPALFTVKDSDSKTDNNTIFVHSASYYVPPMSRAISDFKDHENMAMLPLLLHGVYRLAVYLENKPSDSVILPMPTPPKRLVERGFLPVVMLAKFLSLMTGFDLYTGISRPIDTTRQRGLDKTARQHNIKNAFVVDSLPASRHVIIFDDVVTTGATINELAKTLVTADKNTDYAISGVCLAHGSPR